MNVCVLMFVDVDRLCVCVDAHLLSSCHLSRPCGASAAAVCAWCAWLQDAARAAGAIPAVMQALETHKENRDVAHYGCLALGSLAFINPANQVPRAA